MNKTIVKYGIKIVGGITLVCLGGRLVYEAGCQKGITTSEWLVEKYEPEAYQRLCQIVTNYKKD